VKLHSYPVDMRPRLTGTAEFTLQGNDKRTVRAHYRRMRRRGMSALMARFILIDLLEIGRWSR
jgi:hypothetical protein